jgi:hypothetical protein
VSRIAEAYVQIVPSMAGASATLQKEFTAAGGPAAQGFGSGFGSTLKRLAGPIAAAFTIGAGVTFFKGAVEEASNLSESQNAIKVTFGEASEAIAKLGEDSASRLGLSTSKFNDIAVQFSSFAGKIAGDGGDVTAVIDEISTRGADFASVMNLDVNQALGAFQSGLSGEAEPLKKFGIDLSDASVKAYALANGIGDGTGVLTEAEKVQARYGSLMEQTAKVQGDFTNTSDGLANAQRIMSAEFDNAQARLGEIFMPILANAATLVTAEVIPAFEALVEGLSELPAWIEANKGWIVPLLAGLGAAVIGVKAVATAMKIQAVGGLAAYVASMFPAIVSTWAFTAALLANPMTWVVIGIAALIAAIVLLAMNWDTVVKFVTDVWGKFITWITAGIDSFVTGWNSAWGGIADFFRKTFESLVGFVKKPLNAIIGMVNKVIGALNSLKFDIPDWVPLLGGKSLSFNIPKIPLLADGGVIGAAGSVIVGEEGPEMLTLPKGARVTPLSTSGGMSDQPIIMDGSFVGVLRQLANGEARIVLDTAVESYARDVRAGGLAA